MFHYVTGIPFESETHGGAYDELTLWEQIDEGAQYTPAKKWLVCTPIALCVYWHSGHQLLLTSTFAIGSLFLHTIQTTIPGRLQLILLL